MSYQQHSRLRAFAPESFEDQLYKQLQNAPWIAASLGVHIAVFGILWLLPSADVTDTPATAVQVAKYEEPPVLDDQDPEPEAPTPDTDIERKPEDVIDENPDPVSDDEDMDNDDPLGMPDYTSYAKFDAFSTNAMIGIGGDAGGPFGTRFGGGDGKGGGGGDGGSGDPTQPAVDAALDWLARHQSPNGSWDCDGYSAQCKKNQCDGAGDGSHDAGVTGLALLPFLARGSTHLSGEYKHTVRRGLDYLRKIQDAEGCFGPRTSKHYQYDTSTAALAMIEAYGMTKSKSLKGPATRAVGFIQKSQNPYLAWRYGVADGDNDTSVSGWMVMALKSAKMSGLDVDGGAFRNALAWVDKMTEPEFGRVGYQRRGGPPARTTEMMDRFPPNQSESLTAVGATTRIFCGEKPSKSEYISKAADLMVKKAPRWDIDAGTIDMYYWYYGTLAMHQVGGPRWKKWNAAMKTAIVDNQHTDESRDEAGSWDPIGPWGREGGRVYSTALMTLCLEVYYRYERVK